MVLLCKPILIDSVCVLKLFDLNHQLLDLLTKRALHWISLQETCNLLLAEQEFVLNESLHVDIAINDCI